MKTNIYHYLLTLPKIWIYGIIMLFCSSSHSVLANGNELFPIRPSEVLFEINSNNRKGNLAEHSEQISVSGRVLDEIDQPLPGATVLEKDTQNGTVTDYDGRFTLSVADDATLLISFLGY
ncbi:MAG: carboxypeptidase-like regulatory domain-containing protein, partial [Cytophagales bacterium]|nr:carboxypeptidase-like regulatory domain-containing protein [Cytophagales bacterium]